MYWDENGQAVFLAPVPDSEEDTKRWREFRAFDERNPKLWEEFKRLTHEAIDTGFERIGAHLILSLIRWNSRLDSQGDKYKVRNDWFPYYARKFLEEFPEHRGIFEIRGLKRHD